MVDIKIPDVPGPRKRLCYAQQLTAPRAMSRCDRAKGHGGGHTWELLNEIDALKASRAMALDPTTGEPNDEEPKGP